MVDNTPLLILAAAVIAIIGLAIGAVIGVILSGLRTPPSEAPDHKDLTELARLVRHSRTGQLGVELNGKVYASSKALTSAQKTALTQAHKELQGWLGVDDLPGRTTDTPVQPPIAPTQRVHPPEAPRPAAPTLPPAPTPPPPVHPSRSLRPEPASSVRPPSMEIGDILARAINPPEPGKDALELPTTLAGQVDAIIQERLPQSPLRERKIQMKDGPDGGILVLVDGQKFYGVGEVTDAPVREFIQACVAEWEKKYG